MVHLACGLLLYLLVQRLARRVVPNHSDATWLALATAALWLAHPIQVSTVLYVVQRMAQLSTLFVLVALLSYAAARDALEQGQVRRGRLLLFFAYS
jgi:hypothetical protein